MINKNKKVILDVLNELNLLTYIENLPHKFNTNIFSLPDEKRYLIGLARAILSGSEIIAIYDFPSGMLTEEKEHMKSVIKSLQGKRTLIIFANNDNHADVADKVVYVEKGEIKNIVFTNNR